MEDILFILVARDPSGREKRFATLFKSLMSISDYSKKITLLISRSQINKISSYDEKNINANLRIVPIGCSSKFSYLFPKFEKLWRFYDYLSFFLYLLFKQKKTRLVYYITISSQIFSRFVKSEKSIVALVGSNETERIVKLKSFTQLLKKGAKVDCLSHSIKKRAIQNINCCESQFFVSPCSFIDYSTVPVNKKAKPTVITFCSRLIYVKGINILLEALCDILDQNSDSEIWIIGDGPLKEEVHNCVRELRVQKRVKVFGHVKEPMKLLSKSNIYLSLQRNENYPSQSLIEAMACGNAIIATDVGDTKMLVDGEVGYLISTDSDKLVSAVRSLLDNDSLCNQMGQNAKERVMNKHTTQRYLQYLEGFL